MDLKINIEGAAALEQLLKQLPERMARNVVNRALNEGAKDVVEEARNSAPVGVYDAADQPTAARRKSGPLRRAIRRARLRAGETATVQVGIGRAFWGMFQEFGTRRMPARPWFRAAWERSRLKALSSIGAALGKGIETEAVKLASEVRLPKAGRR